MPSAEYKSIGFIGLGAMGRPMATHLANKLPDSTRIYVFDVAKSVVDEFAKEHPNKVFIGESAKDIADKSVSLEPLQNLRYSKHRLI